MTSRGLQPVHEGHLLTAIDHRHITQDVIAVLAAPYLRYLPGLVGRGGFGHAIPFRFALVQADVHAAFVLNTRLTGL